MKITKDVSVEKTMEYKDHLFALESFCEKNKKILAIAVALLLLIIPQLGLSQYVMRICIMIGVYSMLALGLNLLTGYTGLVSLVSA